MFENYLFTDDDTPEHQVARIALIKNTLIPVGNGLISLCPNMCWALNATPTVLDCYKKIRDDAKMLMDANQYRDHIMVIDRHKIAAAMIIAILEVEPLRLVNNLDAELVNERYANEILAFKTAVRILRIFSNHDAALRTGNAQAKSNLPVFPRPQGGVTYEHHAYRALRHARKQGKEHLNLPLLANWMFYIEKYWCIAEELAAKSQGGQTKALG